MFTRHVHLACSPRARSSLPPWFQRSCPAGDGRRMAAVAARPACPARPLGGAVATGMAFSPPTRLLDGEVPSWPPAQARHWLFYLAAGLTMLGFFDSVTERFIHVPNWVRAEAALLACGCIVLCLFWSLLQGDTWTSSRAALWVVAMVVVMHLTWVSTEVLVDRLPRSTGPAILLVFTAGAALVLMLSGSAGVRAACRRDGHGGRGGWPCRFWRPAFGPPAGPSPFWCPRPSQLSFSGIICRMSSAANASLVLSALLLPWLAHPPASRCASPGSVRSWQSPWP